MFNNTFQAILLLITFTIRRKRSSTQTLETQLCKHQSVAVPRNLQAVVTGLGDCCRRYCSRRLLLLPLQRSPHRNATRVLQRGPSPWARALLSHRPCPLCCRRADPCCWEPGRVPAARAPSPWPWVHVGNVHHVPLLPQKPRQFICAQLEGWSAWRSEKQTVQTAVFPILFQNREHTCRWFFFFPICAYFKVSKQRFLNIFFPYRRRHNNKPSHTDAINSRGRQTVCTFFSFCHVNKLFPKEVIDHLIRATES